MTGSNENVRNKNEVVSIEEKAITFYSFLFVLQSFEYIYTILRLHLPT